MATQPETLFKMKVRPLLEAIPSSWWFKVEAGAVGGIPDIIGTVKGRFCALELKTETGRPSALQLHILQKISNAGGFARLVLPSNLDSVLAELRQL